MQTLGIERKQNKCPLCVEKPWKEVCCFSFESMNVKRCNTRWIGCGSKFCSTAPIKIQSRSFLSVSHSWGNAYNSHPHPTNHSPRLPRSRHYCPIRTSLRETTVLLGFLYVFFSGREKETGAVRIWCRSGGFRCLSYTLDTQILGMFQEWGNEKLKGIFHNVSLKNVEVTW